MLRIAEARIARGWSQEQLAQAVGTTQQTIQRWETGQTDPQVSKVKAISAALGATLSYLLGVDDVGCDSQTLSEDERHLVALFRACSQQGREYLTQVAEVTANMFGRE